VDEVILAVRRSPLQPRWSRPSLAEWLVLCNPGLARSQLEVTAEGDQAARDWLRQPVTQPGDIRSELLVKLALLSRVSSDPRDLLRKQRAQLAPIADALAAQTRAATGFDYTLALWRHESISAMLRFLDAILVTVPVQLPTRDR
jgi:hypothetical protein